MRRNLSSPMCTDHRAPLVWALLALALSGCMDSASIPCAPGEFYCPATQRCSASGTSCMALTDTCGDGVLQPGEACDDGNRRNGDGCNQSCTSDESCGNGFQDPSEACDDGNTLSGDGCSADCKSKEFCGNGYTDTAKGERCDDGNNDSGDGCSGDCRSEEICGNGYVDLARGEVCDDGNNRSGDGCSSDCLSNETCGNGYKDPMEYCDDGNNQDGDQCSADCSGPGQGCGNGRVDPGELCDDGDTSDLNSCLSTCVPARCGDGIVSPQASYPEQCDPGQPDTDTATCTRFCRLSYCGDRYINPMAEEQCEDGNSDNCGTCSATCKVVQNPAQATGFIDAARASDLREGETFTLDDGIHAPMTFVFSNSTENTGHVKIRIQGTAAEMAQAIITAIKKNQTNLNILASLDPRPNEDDRVQLVHWFETALGNRRIVHTVRANGFFVEGMAGGAAGDCAAGVGCRAYHDCAPWLQCRNGVCSP
jgi:cysteine-rich repeat protein